jgi:hypothetical protein
MERLKKKEDWNEWFATGRIFPEQWKQRQLGYCGHEVVPCQQSHRKMPDSFSYAVTGWE